MVNREEFDKLEIIRPNDVEIDGYKPLTLGELVADPRTWEEVRKIVTTFENMRAKIIQSHIKPHRYVFVRLAEKGLLSFKDAFFDEVYKVIGKCSDLPAVERKDLMRFFLVACQNVEEIRKQEYLNEKLRK